MPPQRPSEKGSQSSLDLVDWIDVEPLLGQQSGLAGSSPSQPSAAAAAMADVMPDRIVRITADEKDLKNFYNISLSKTREAALRDFYQNELADLEALPFERFGQEDQVDYLLLRNYLRRNLRGLDLDARRFAQIEPFVPFAGALIDLFEARQRVALDEVTHAARHFTEASKQARAVRAAIDDGELSRPKMAAFRAVRVINELRGHLDEFCSFFRGYDPLFDWWVTEPARDLQAALQELVTTIQTQLVGSTDKDEIVGDAIGAEGLRVELEAEMIPYEPRQLLEIARRQYAWCEAEMKKASGELGFGDDWKAALSHVQGLWGQPGQQPRVIKELVDEGAAYVQDHDLVSVPSVAERTWRMKMMSPERQKVNPFFLGGPIIQVSYPTACMSHEDKMMSMRGNGRHLSRATAFHEMIPGHHLQLFMAARHRPYRRRFTTPFYVEGWALYWEMQLWNRGDFFVIPEDRVGTLFWRMHRCIRIVFSLEFHLGRLTPQECVDLLVDRVGHERATAEGEVRRSLAGDYSPLYQAGYMLGALQIMALREEALQQQSVTPSGTTFASEKEFHDRILRANEMPIEMLRALLLNKPLVRDYKPQWKFYGDL